jgi:hypothetical protein
VDSACSADEFDLFQSQLMIGECFAWLLVGMTAWAVGSDGQSLPLRCAALPLACTLRHRSLSLAARTVASSTQRHMRSCSTHCRCCPLGV